MGWRRVGRKRYIFLVRRHVEGIYDMMGKKGSGELGEVIAGAVYDEYWRAFVGHATCTPGAYLSLGI